jgi:hypothetical protein
MRVRMQLDRLRVSTAYAPVLVGVPLLGAGIWGLVRRGSLRQKILGGALVYAGALVLAKPQLERFFAEKPSYRVVERIGPVEIRSYAPRLVAETVVDTHRLDLGLREGFQRLAGFLLGANTTRTVLTERVNTSERIAKTVPVTARRFGTGLAVAFTMPRDRTLGTMPVPHDPTITIHEAPAERVAALRFRGRADAARVQDKERELLHRVIEAGLDPSGDPAFASYDPPATLPFLRRSEVWMPV